LGFSAAVDKFEGKFLLFIAGKLGFSGHPLEVVGDGAGGGLNE
jgi:hypothetical protein